MGLGASFPPILGPSGAPVWNSPTYDAATGRVYFGSGENYSTPADDGSDAVFAVDAATGKRCSGGDTLKLSEDKGVEVSI